MFAFGLFRPSPFRLRVLAPLVGAAFATLAASASRAGEPLKITVYGGTGNIGQRIVHEALERGHEVKVVVRDPSRVKEQHARLTVSQGDVLDSKQVAQTIAGQDVIVSAVSFRAASPDFSGYRKAGESLVAALRGHGTSAPRLIVVGGAGSLEVAPGVLLAERIPAAYQGEVLGQKAALDYYRTITDVPWTYFSPAGLIEPGKRTGRFRLGGDQLVTDAKGESRISMEDYAVAVLDEAEKPAHIHERFTIGY